MARLARLCLSLGGLDPGPLKLPGKIGETSLRRTGTREIGVQQRRQRLRCCWGLTCWWELSQLASWSVCSLLVTTTGGRKPSLGLSLRQSPTRASTRARSSPRVPSPDRGLPSIISGLAHLVAGVTESPCQHRSSLVAHHRGPHEVCVRLDQKHDQQRPGG